MVPQESNVSSRHDVKLDMVIGHILPITLKFPVIAAPMDTVCDTDMCIAMNNEGGLGILHRYMTMDFMKAKVRKLIKSGFTFGVSVGATNGYMNDVEDLYNMGVRIILVDTANGHSHYAVDAVRSIRKLSNDIHIMAGNIATPEGFARIIDAGADSVRVGIGGGSACTTRIVSGHGVPTLQSIIDIHQYRINHDLPGSIIADGGIRNSGDMVKSFAAGADAVMAGSIFAGTDESPGEVLTNQDGNKVKMFRGMASAAAQKDAAGKVSVAEGISTTVPYKGPVKRIFDQIRGGLGSGCSYSGVTNLSELNLDSEYVIVSNASLNESRPHAL
jgi:IMP dehydrogenase